jgi:hypothetical protein
MDVMKHMGVVAASTPGGWDPLPTIRQLLVGSNLPQRDPQGVERVFKSSWATETPHACLFGFWGLIFTYIQAVFLLMIHRGETYLSATLLAPILMAFSGAGDEAVLHHRHGKCGPNCSSDCGFAVRPSQTRSQRPLNHGLTPLDHARPR